MRAFLLYLDKVLVMKDDFLVSFFHDLGGLFNLLWNGIQMILGLGYLCGKFFAESLVTTFYFLLDTATWIGTLLQGIVLLIAELVTDLLKGFLLLYYCFFKIIEAFNTTFWDLIYFIGHVCTTISGFVGDGFQLVWDWVLAARIIPKQLYGGIVIFSDTFLFLCTSILGILYDFATQLILSPIHAAAFIGRSCLKVIIVISIACGNLVDSIASIPISVHLAIIVFTICFMTYRRISVLTIFKSCAKGIRKMFGGCQRAGKSLSTRLAIYFKVKPYELDSDYPEDYRENTSGMCVICQEKLVSFISTPCNHVCLCDSCVYELVKTDNRCPLCRSVVVSFTKVFVS